ncbi:MULTISPECIES: elongation factor P hydroxylase [Halomonadaceae]|uniref:elongation factor P hydroxylase n=1 Tax=Halomonadaceae TaxID=28256 RepID=UPI00266701FA|nr:MULTISPECIES: elongation factor P hydroxylase [unclassified Halomonas]
MDYALEDVMALFDGLFLDTFNTCLVRGESEPLYLPADSDCPHHRVIFAHGYFASALHEMSHWCIAGARRRELEDYGYWYLPDGRDADQQRRFESVEVMPQAIEMLFARACARRFAVSVDNLGDIEVDREAFSARVELQAAEYEAQGLPPRAAAFRETLATFYRQGKSRTQAIEAGRRLLESRLAADVITTPG